MKQFGLLFVLCLFSLFVHAQNNKQIYKLLKQDREMEQILSSDVYDVQIIYTQVERTNEKIVFKDYYYKVDKNYFYPSTTVSLPAAVLVLEKINSIAKECDVDKFRNVRFEHPDTHAMPPDTSKNYTNFAEILQKMLSTNDRNSFNDCYDFLNQRYFNERFHELGYKDSWFLNKFDNNPPENSKFTNSVIFFKTNIQSYFIDIVHLRRHPTVVPFLNVYIKKSEENPVDYYSGRQALPLGKGYVENDTLIKAPFDFARMNKFPLKDMHGFLRTMILPEIRNKKLNLDEDDYNLIYKSMRENKSHILDNLPAHSVTVLSNTGKDMGFLTESAYIVDSNSGCDFFLTIMIKCNRDDIFGENQQEYEKIGVPFIRKVSRIIYDYDRTSRKKHQPANFDAFLDRLKQ